ncbi:MAG: carboxypeptidase Q [Pseudomonadales bacterium]|jgi:carboxypeptidase Q
MNFRNLLILVAVVVSNWTYAVTDDELAVMRDSALASTDGYDLVESLTTKVGARLAGTDADKRAVAWAKDLLEQSGFDKVWLEPVNFPVWQRYKETAKVLPPYEQNLQITALGYSGSTSGAVVAEVMAFSSIEEFAQSKTDVKGKIFFINKAMQRSLDGSGYSDTVPMRYISVVSAQQKQVAGILIRSLGTHSNRFAHTGVTVLLDNPVPAAALSPPDADQLQRLLDLGQPVKISLDIQVSITQGGSSFNVIGQLNGSESPEQNVLISAHLDSWDLGTGAIDDGAGVGIVVAAAKAIMTLPERPRRSIRVVLFANEEQGLWGAKQYAKKHKADAVNHIFASESDFGAGRVWRFDSASKSLNDSVTELLAPLGITVNLVEGDDIESLSGGPDIGPIQDTGVAVFKLKQDGTDYFDYHHTANDTLDKIDPKALQQNVAAWAVVAFKAANIELDTSE